VNKKMVTIQVKYIATVDAGRSNVHIALYRQEAGKITPEKEFDLPKLSNEVYRSSRDGILTERIDETTGIVKGFLSSLSKEIKDNLAAVVIDSHGAAGYVLDKKGNPMFTQVYDDLLSDEVKAKFYGICGGQDELYDLTSSPALPAQINWMMQIATLLDKYPG